MPGTLLVLPLYASISRDADLVDPYCTIKIGQQAQHSPPCKDGGKNPNWLGSSMSFRISTEDQITIEIWDKDSSTKKDSIAQGTLNLSLILSSDDQRSATCQLTYKGKPAGVADIKFEWYPDREESAKKAGLYPNLPVQQPGYQPQPGGYQQPPPGGYQQPPPGGYQQPPPGGFQQPPPGGYQQPPPGGFQQPPPGGYQQPPPGGYQQPPPGGYKQPPPPYQQPPPGGYQQPPPGGYQQPPPGGYQYPPPQNYQQPSAYQQPPPNYGPQPGYQQPPPVIVATKNVPIYVAPPVQPIVEIRYEDHHHHHHHGIVHDMKHALKKWF